MNNMSVLYIAISIGFLDTSYVVDESSNEVSLQVGAISGSLQRDLLFAFSTINMDAIGKLLQVMLKFLK